jgi:hypothetical protein
MKKATRSLFSGTLIMFLGLIFMNSPVQGQDTTRVSPPLPENINTIVTKSCMSCHSAQGGLMARSKLNFTVWTQYSAAKQKEKADKMVSLIVKGTMPPKSARENHPENIPTPDQTESIKKWAESLNTSPDK